MSNNEGNFKLELWQPDVSEKEEVLVLKTIVYIFLKACCSIVMQTANVRARFKLCKQLLEYQYLLLFRGI